jgi:hypothetical protein
MGIIAKVNRLAGPGSPETMNMPSSNLIAAVRPSSAPVRARSPPTSVLDAGISGGEALYETVIALLTAETNFVMARKPRTRYRLVASFDGPHRRQPMPAARFGRHRRPDASPGMR